MHLASAVAPILPPICLRIHDGRGHGVIIAGAKGRLESCDIWGNEFSGVTIQAGADPVVTKCE